MRAHGVDVMTKRNNIVQSTASWATVTPQSLKRILTLAEHEPKLILVAAHEPQLD
jgi:hypothetical protein